MSSIVPIHHLNVAAESPAVDRVEVEGVVFQVAGNVEQRRRAFRLVYDAYVQSGLMRETPQRMRILPQHLHAETAVFLATQNDQILCTASLVRDNPDGLPMESLYGSEVRERRRLGLNLSEVSCLASHRELISHRQMLTLITRMIAILGSYAHFHGVDRVLIAVHPRHFAITTGCWDSSSLGRGKLFEGLRSTGRGLRVDRD